MFFELDNIYHIYNMGNNSQKIFYSAENYVYFIQKTRNELIPYCDILAYCLMPNHFHFMIYANANSIVENKKTGQQVLTRKIGTLLSSYTRAINKEKNWTGSLFRQKTKAKNLKEYITYPIVKKEYIRTCFDYIHQNPVDANLVSKAEEWKFSSFPEYFGVRNEILINKNLAIEVLNLNKNNLMGEYDENDITNIF